VGDNPSPLVRALSYDDPRVQFAAAVALIRQPGPPTHGKQARVVDILRQALGADVDGSGAGTLGRALIADTDPVRGEGLAQMFREAGYAAERYATGRQLVARLSRASDYDLIVVDRHVSTPLLSDTLTQVTADLNAANRPVFVVASGDKPRPLPLEILLLRLANAVAATDDGVIQAGSGMQGSRTLRIVVPPPYAFDPLRPDRDRDEARRNVVLARDRAMIGPSDAGRAAAMEQAARDGTPPPPPDQSLFTLRLDRLKRLVQAADLPTSGDLATRLSFRLPQLVMAGMASEFGATPETAPRTVERLEQATRNLLARRELAASARDIPDLGNLVRLLEQLDAKMSVDQKERFRRIQGGVRRAQLALPTDYFRDTELEETLADQVKRLPSVHILSDPFAAEYLKADIEDAIQNPAQQPRDPAERVESAKVAAELLRRMAVGELEGYHIHPAESELRKALRNDATAELVIDAVARLRSRAAQEDLVTLALTASRPLPLRVKSADAAIRHVQTFGKLAAGALAEQLAVSAPAEADLALRGKLGVLANLLTGQAGDFGGVLQRFPVRLAFPQPSAPVPPPKNPPVLDPNDPNK
jgi:CheY-like chemotaxis protein